MKIVSFPCATIVLISFLLGGCAHVYTSYENVELSHISKIPAVSKDSLFEISKMWIAQEFRSAKNVIEYENKTEGVLIGNGSINYPCTENSSWCYVRKSDYIKFNMRIDVKNEKVKLSFLNIKHIYHSVDKTLGERTEINIIDTAALNSTFLGLNVRMQDYIIKMKNKSDW